MSITAPAAKWRKRFLTKFAAIISRRTAPGWNRADSIRWQSKAMREIGIDISQNQTQSVFDVFKSGELFAYVITVCDESSAGRCPIFAGVTKRLHWSFPDPAALSGTHEERLAGTRKIRDQICARLEMWCDETCPIGAVG